MSCFARLPPSAFVAALLLVIPVADAHHSFAMFDFTRTVTISGTVKEFQWTNPHVILWVDVPGKDPAKPDSWWLEMTSPGNLTRGGWNRNAVSPGDQVEVELNPLRDGKLGGALVKVTDKTNGKTFSTNFRDMEKPGLK